jgi:hypothetical protein
MLAFAALIAVNGHIFDCSSEVASRANIDRFLLILDSQSLGFEHVAAERGFTRHESVRERDTASEHLRHQLAKKILASAHLAT